jgi:hypothetical protein
MGEISRLSQPGTPGPELNLLNSQAPLGVLAMTDEEQKQLPLDGLEEMPMMPRCEETGPNADLHLVVYIPDGIYRTEKNSPWPAS